MMFSKLQCEPKRDTFEMQVLLTFMIKCFINIVISVYVYVVICFMFRICISTYFVSKNDTVLHTVVLFAT